jgi:hypothetical protein
MKFAGLLLCNLERHEAALLDFFEDEEYERREVEADQPPYPKPPRNFAQALLALAPPHI